MRISFYGSLAEVIAREVELSVPTGATVAGVRQHLGDLYPAAAPILRRPGLRACLDDVVVEDDAVVLPDAELSFLPPLSGG